MYEIDLFEDIDADLIEDHEQELTYKKLDGIREVMRMLMCMRDARVAVVEYECSHVSSLLCKRCLETQLLPCFIACVYAE